MLSIEGDEVYVRLKSYNSYCVEELSVSGADQSMARWLMDKNISVEGFESLVKGQYEPRLFLPLQGQEVAGQVIELMKDASGTATSLKVLSKAGDEVVADRSTVYVYSHWMGKSDLAYCMLGGEFAIVLLISRYCCGWW